MTQSYSGAIKGTSLEWSISEPNYQGLRRVTIYDGPECVFQGAADTLSGARSLISQFITRRRHELEQELHSLRREVFQVEDQERVYGRIISIKRELEPYWQDQSRSVYAKRTQNYFL